MVPQKTELMYGAEGGRCEIAEVVGRTRKQKSHRSQEGSEDPEIRQQANPKLHPKTSEVNLISVQ